MRPVGRVAWLVWLACAACTTTHPNDRDAGPGPDGSDAPSVCRDDGPTPPGCAATWEEAQTAPDCSPVPGLDHLGHAGDLLARVRGGAYGGLGCYYDPSTHALVGGFSSHDSPDFCNHTSPTIFYGAVPTDLAFQPDLGDPPACPDAGGVCREPARPGMCPATWEAAQTDIDCRGAFTAVEVGASGDFLARRVTFGPGSDEQCFYDGTTHALAGSSQTAPSPTFCGGTSTDAYDGAAAPGLAFVADPNGVVPACPGTGNCRTDLSKAPCPATWEAAQAEPDCFPGGNVVHLGHAGAFLARVVDGGGTTIFGCYYDAGTHALVGAFVTTDYEQYCNNSSFDLFFGSTTTLLPFQPDLGAPPPCPDGGT